MNRYIHKNYSLKTHAKDLRNNSTPAERQLWVYLREKQLNGIKFRRQHVLAPYILDFYCSSKKLAIEIDGGTHIGHEKYDRIREDFLKVRGITIIRFSNTEIKQNLSFVIDKIKEILNSL
jgi:very-short-patch-repair endonuclease